MSLFEKLKDYLLIFSCLKSCFSYPLNKQNISTWEIIAHIALKLGRNRPRVSNVT